MNDRKIIDPSMREMLKSILAPAQESPSGELISKATFANSFPVFRGHFPDHPILPGFFHILCTIHILEEYKQTRYRLLEIQQCRFKSPISPGETVTFLIRTESREKETLVSCQLTASSEKKSSLRFRLIKMP